MPVLCALSDNDLNGAAHTFCALGLVSLLKSAAQQVSLDTRARRENRCLLSLSRVMPTTREKTHAFGARRHTCVPNDAGQSVSLNSRAEKEMRF